MRTEDQEALARLLAGLRRDRRTQSGLAAELTPPDAATAYEVAAMVERALGRAVAGWKIAAFKPEMQAQLRADAPIYGRIYEGGVFRSPATVAHAEQCSPIPEAEFVATLGRDLPPRESAYTRDEVSDAIESFSPGIELAECRFVHDKAFPPLPAILADGAGGGGLVMGAPIPDWRERDLAGQEVTLSCRGEIRRRGSAAESLDHPIEPVLWLANALSKTGIGLRAGQVVSTGTLTGMLRPKAGETFVADFGPFGQVSATYA